MIAQEQAERELTTNIYMTFWYFQIFGRETNHCLDLIMSSEFMVVGTHWGILIIIIMADTHACMHETLGVWHVMAWENVWLKTNGSNFDFFFYNRWFCVSLKWWDCEVATFLSGNNIILRLLRLQGSNNIISNFYLTKETIQSSLFMNCIWLDRLDLLSCTSLTLKSVFKQTFEDAITKISTGELPFKIHEYVGSLYKTRWRKKKKRLPL